VLGVGNKPFQDDLKQLFSEELLTGDHALTPADRIKKPSVTLLCHWIVIALQHISPEVTVLRSVVYPMQWLALMMICCGMAVEWKGKLGVSVRKKKVLTVKRETVTVIGKGR
jgi:hypothetical protein